MFCTLIFLYFHKAAKQLLDQKTSDVFSKTSVARKIFLAIVQVRTHSSRSKKLMYQLKNGLKVTEFGRNVDEKWSKNVNRRKDHEGIHSFVQYFDGRSNGSCDGYENTAVYEKA